jgi:AcrR family transcriptional regulator
MPRVKQRTPDLRRQVVDVALGLLESEGAGGLTTRSLAQRAGTTTPAVYEFFGDKAGLVRELYFEGFRALHDQLAALGPAADPLAGLRTLAQAYRHFIVGHRVLAEVMFSRPFTDFAPGPEELAATASVRLLLVGHVQRAVEAGRLAGDATDIAHVLVALIQGLAAAENAGRLGTSSTSIDRRWAAALAALLQGFAAPPVASLGRPAGEP